MADTQRGSTRYPILKPRRREEHGTTTGDPDHPPQMSGLAKSRTWSTSRSGNGQPTGEQHQYQQHQHQQRDPLRKISNSSSSSSYLPSATATATSVNTLERTTTRHQHVATTSSTFVTKDGHGSPASAGAETEEPVAAPSFLQPRIAAVLGVSRHWHPVLFSLRLLSIVPAICLGFPLAIRFLLMLHEFATAEGSRPQDSEAEDRLLLTETMLAVIWVGRCPFTHPFTHIYTLERLNDGCYLGGRKC